MLNNKRISMIEPLLKEIFKEISDIHSGEIRAGQLGFLSKLRHIFGFGQSSASIRKQAMKYYLSPKVEPRVVEVIGKVSQYIDTTPKPVKFKESFGYIEVIFPNGVTISIRDRDDIYWMKNHELKYIRIKSPAGETIDIPSYQGVIDSATLSLWKELKNKGYDPIDTFEKYTAWLKLRDGIGII